ncbi:CopG family transcriptional regulator [Paraburkholderia sp. GAS38]|uniref:ribbon-helix-helix domain-containing protein n=1 Tax=Paraburkholderia sp. GAS38 TaxID=3035133 RepID=UPI003D211CD1
MTRPRANRKTVRTTVSLDERMYSDVLALATENDVSVAWLMRKALAELLARRGGPDGGRNIRDSSASPSSSESKELG